MAEKKYQIPEDNPRTDLAAEPSVAYSMPAPDLQTLRQNIVDAVYQSQDERKLQSCYMILTGGQQQIEEDNPKIDGEKWAREVLIPTYLEVLEMERKGIDLPDAHELLQMDEIWQ